MCGNRNIHGLEECKTDSTEEGESGEEMLQYMTIPNLKVTGNEEKIKVEVETGASYTVISAFIHKSIFSGSRKKSCGMRLQVVTSDLMEVVGTSKVAVGIGGNNHLLNIVVVNTKTNFILLIGRG